MLDTARRSPFVALLIAVALAAALFVARAALAAPAAARAVVSGAGFQTYDLTTGGNKILLQCREAGNGAGQTVYFRALTSSEVHDAGLNDLVLDFTSNPDAFPLQFTDQQTKFTVANVDGGSVRCPIFNNYLP